MSSWISKAHFVLSSSWQALFFLKFVAAPSQFSLLVATLSMIAPASCNIITGQRKVEKPQ